MPGASSRKRSRPARSHVIDFLSNFLVVRLRGRRPVWAAGSAGSPPAWARSAARWPAPRGGQPRSSGGSLPALARVAGRVGGAVVTGTRAVGRGVRAVGRTIATGAKVVGRTVVAGARAVGRAVVTGVRAVGRTVMAGARALGRTVVAAGRVVGRRLAAGGRALVAALARRFPRVAAAFRRIRTQWQRAKARVRAWRERRRQRRQASAQQRLRSCDRGLRALGFEARARSGRAMRLRAQLFGWRLVAPPPSPRAVAARYPIPSGNRKQPRPDADRRGHPGGRARTASNARRAFRSCDQRTCRRRGSRADHGPTDARARDDAVYADQVPPSPGGAAASRDVRELGPVRAAGVVPRGRAPGGPWSAGQTRQEPR